MKFIYLMTRKVHTKYWHIYSMGKRKIPTRYLIKSKSALGTTKWGSCELERQEWWMHACTVRKEKREARDQRWADRGPGEDSILSGLTSLTWWSCWWNRGPHLLSDPCPESKHLTRFLFRCCSDTWSKIVQGCRSVVWLIGNYWPRYFFQKKR